MCRAIVMLLVLFRSMEAEKDPPSLSLGAQGRAVDHRSFYGFAKGWSRQADDVRDTEAPLFASRFEFVPHLDAPLAV